jgi:hypothetical protein
LPVLRALPLLGFFYLKQRVLVPLALRDLDLGVF